MAARQAEVMEASAYGRALSFGRDTQQAVGVPISVGRYNDPEYPSLVQAIAHFGGKVAKFISRLRRL